MKLPVKILYKENLDSFNEKIVQQHIFIYEDDEYLKEINSKEFLIATDQHPPYPVQKEIKKKIAKIFDCEYFFVKLVLKSKYRVGEVNIADTYLNEVVLDFETEEFYVKWLAKKRKKRIENYIEEI